MMNLREKLTKPQGNQTVTEFFQELRATSAELALINSHVTEDDLIIHKLNGIGNDFKEIVAVGRAWDTII